MKYRPTPKSSAGLRPETWLLIKQIAIGVSALTLFGALLYGVWYGTRLPQFTIASVTVMGEEASEAAVVQAKVEEALSGSYLGLVPKRFTWFYPEEQIGSVVKALPSIKSVTVERESTEVLVEFAEYQPFALWCGEGEAATCHYLDETGYAFAVAPELKGGVFVRYISLGRSPAVAAAVMEADYFERMQELNLALESRGFYPKRVEFDATEDVFVVLADDSELKLSLRASPLKSLEYLDTILDSTTFADLRTKPFDYIDLRFGTKVYVKAERDQVLVATSSATSTDITETTVEEIFVAPIVLPE